MMKPLFSVNISKRSLHASGGFSLIELLVALAVFLVVGGAAVSLFAKHVGLANTQQNQAAVNVALRSAISQIELDASNAGTGYFPGANIADWPIGITVANASQSSVCNTTSTFTFGANCFDTLNIVAVDNSLPPSHPAKSGTTCNSTTASTLFATPTGSTTLTQLAASFHTGDVLMLLSVDGSKLTTVVLTKDGQVSGGKVQLQHNPTGATGSNNDPYLIANIGDANKLGTNFCTQDWILKLSPITFSVDTSDPNNPKLIRTQAGNSDVVAEQIIGFRVGTSNRNGSIDEPYSFNATADWPTTVGGTCTTNCGYNSDWATIRSIRVSVLARTKPDPAGPFRNSFDNGPYKIEGASITINPRNLSMNDQ